MTIWHQVDTTPPWVPAPLPDQGIIKGFCFFDGSSHTLSQDKDLPASYQCNMPRTSKIYHTGFRAYLLGKHPR